MLTELENRIDLLLQACEHLRQENALLQKQAAGFKEREQGWMQERVRLIEKNETAHSRVEAMIIRLKSLEEQS